MCLKDSALFLHSIRGSIQKHEQQREKKEAKFVVFMHQLVIGLVQLALSLLFLDSYASHLETF